MTTKRQRVIAACKTHGIMCLDDGDCIRVDAAPGLVFKTTGHHSYDSYLMAGVPKDENWHSVLCDIERGVMKCQDDDCPTCEEGMTFDEIHKLYGGERLA